MPSSPARDMVTVASLFRDAVQVTPTRDGGSLRSSRLRTIYWIHFPKTSSLFATTVLTYACGADRVPLDRVQNLTTLGPGPQESDCGGMLPRTQCCGHRHSSWFHDPLPWPSPGGGLPKYSVVFMVRDPIQRALSAFRYLLKDLHPKCCGRGWGWEEGSATSSRRAKTAARLGNLSAFLAEPSAAGCQTKMLVGRGCMASKPSSKNETTRAVTFVRKHRPHDTQLACTLWGVGGWQEVRSVNASRRFSSHRQSRDRRTLNL
jgi:hypothetical protein